MLPEYRITAGFMPLTDSLLLVVAREKGFAAAEGVDLALVKETSWANIRDRVAVGHFDVAHMLAPMPIAATLGLTPIAGAGDRADGAWPGRQRGDGEHGAVGGG